jgi:plastocyanin
MGFRRVLFSAALSVGLTSGVAILGNDRAAILAKSAGASTELGVELQSFAFAPDNVTVVAGQPATFLMTNPSPNGHVLAFTGAGGEWRSERVGPGESGTFTVTFEQPGTYEMWCPVSDHRERGMVGTLTVGG